jgi:hypothetical protein
MGLWFSDYLQPVLALSQAVSHSLSFSNNANDLPFLLTIKNKRVHNYRHETRSYRAPPHINLATHIEHTRFAEKRGHGWGCQPASPPLSLRNHHKKVMHFTCYLSLKTSYSVILMCKTHYWLYFWHFDATSLHVETWDYIFMDTSSIFIRKFYTSRWPLFHRLQGCHARWKHWYR